VFGRQFGVICSVPISGDRSFATFRKPRSCPFPRYTGWSAGSIRACRVRQAVASASPLLASPRRYALNPGLSLARLGVAWSPFTSCRHGHSGAADRRHQAAVRAIAVV